MKRRLMIAALLPALLLANACGGDGDTNSPQRISGDEQRALEEAAQMIEAQRLPDDALPKNAGDNAPDAGQTQKQQSETRPQE